MFSIIDNKARKQKLVGHHVVSHNILSREHLRRLYEKKSLSKDSPRWFQTSMVFTISILTAMGPNTLATLTASQFRKCNIQDKLVFIISAAVGSSCSAPKSSRGGCGEIDIKIQEIPV